MTRTATRASLAVVLLLLLGVAALSRGGQAGSSSNFIPAPGSPLQPGNKPSDLAIADVNGDGALDMVCAIGGDRTIVALLGNGKGAFRPAPAGPVAAGEPMHLVVAGDFNGDKRPDIAATAHDSNSVAVFFGDGRGGFAPAPRSPFAAYSGIKPHNHGLAAGDVNGDGRLDLTLGHQDAGSIAALLNDGRGGFAPADGSPFRVGRGFYPHALGDMNADGKLDVVAPDIMGDAIVVALGSGRGAFAEAAGSPVRVRPRPYFVAVADINGDRLPDVLATHDDSAEVAVLVGDGRGGLSPGRGFNAGHRGHTTIVADLNGDGRKDVLIGGMSGVKALLGDGRGRFSASAEWSVDLPRPTWKFVAADFNGDGKADLALIDIEGGTVPVMLQR